MPVHLGSTPCTMQMSWEKPSEHTYFLSVLAKRTYSVDRSGRCRVAAKQRELQGLCGDTARDGCVEHDSDIWPFKPLTDVVVQGHAYAPHGPERNFVAKLKVGPIEKSLLIVGDRLATVARTGRILFSDATLFDKIPLTYDRAYGGIDRVAEETHGNPMMVFDKYRRPELQPEYHSPYIYPRNGAGRGYLVEATSQAVDALQLPNIEDPADPISRRESLAVGCVLHWTEMPLPWGTNWLHPAFFPRVGYLGAARQFEREEGAWPEVQRGFAPPGFPRLGAVQDVMDPRFYNGGSLGLQLPSMRGDLSGLEFRLSGLHPSRGDFAFRLPERPPQIWIDGRGKRLTETEAVLHHVVVRPDEDEVTVLWRGAGPALRPYAEEELERMPYKVEWD